MDPDETRAAVARRRLAQLVASFESGLPRDEPEDEPATDEPTVDPPIHRHPGFVRSHVPVIATVVAAAAVVLVWVVLSGRPDTTEAPTSTATSVVSTDESGGSESGAGSVEEVLVIDVQGHVNRPGIVTLPLGSRAYEAIDAAGGLSGPIDTTGINMARELTDGEQLLVGIEPAPGVPGAAGTSGTAGSGPIDLNRATESDLLELPGVGPVTAAAIVAWRDDNGRFTSVDDLLEVRGIGDATLAELRDLVTV